jgi:CubicO group peptidase (beta-lactamase class C family)
VSCKPELLTDPASRLKTQDRQFLASRRALLKASFASTFAPAWLTGCLLETTPGAAPPSYKATIADARSAIHQALVDFGTPSISVALFDQNHIAWAESFGVIDKASGATPSNETLFCIGSCSKMLAAISVMILCDRGLVELDAPLIRYLPSFKMASPEYVQITVRMLINHSSGFPGTDYRNSDTTSPYPTFAAQAMQTLAMARLKHLPGEMSVYCNDGFTMVEPLIEALAGKPYVQFVGDEILRPLGMTLSRYAQQAFPEGSFAPGYAGDRKLPQEFLNFFGSGGLYTTPSEMARLGMMLLNDGQLNGRRILQAASLQQMAVNQTRQEALQPVIMADGHGLGWDGVREDGLASVGITAWHKDGGTSIYGTDFFVLPDEKLGVLISGTSTDYPSGMLAQRILISALVERGRLAALPVPLAAHVKPVPVATGAQIADWDGIYANASALLRLEAQTDQTFTVSAYAGGRWNLLESGYKLRTDGTLSIDASPLTPYRNVSAAGQRYLSSSQPYGLRHYLVELPYAQKLTAQAPLSAAWQARLGEAWLVVNARADTFGFATSSPRLSFGAVPGLPGYIVTNAPVTNKFNQISNASASDTVAHMCLKIPVVQGRDLDDVVIETRAGEEWVRVGSCLFRPLAGVPTFTGTSATLDIGSEGLAEWCTLAAAATLTIAGAEAWRLYDSSLVYRDSGTGNGKLTAVPQGAYLLVYGAANATITLTSVR